MLHALMKHGVRPDLIVGTSVGALHGAAVARSPSVASVEKLETTWSELAGLGVLGSSWFTDATILLRTRTHMRSSDPLRRLATRLLGVETFEELAVPFQCVAACIERSAEHWFSSGPLSTRSSRPPWSRGSFRLCGSTASTSSTAGSSTVSRSIEPSRSGPTRSSSYTSAASTARSPSRSDFATSRWSRSRSRGGTDSYESWQTSRTVSPSTCSRPAIRPFGRRLTQLRYRNFRGSDRRIAWAYAATDAYLAGLR